MKDYKILSLSCLSTFFLQQMPEKWIEINRNCRTRVRYGEARDNVAPGDCKNIELLFF